MALEPLQIGQIVYSKCGRDKSMVFVVVALDGKGFAYLADGALRTLAKPKKKKEMHIQVTKHVAEDIKEKLTERRHLMDADIRKALLPYKTCL